MPPTVSSACRSHRPRRAGSGGFVGDHRIARAPRMPLPMRSINRAPSTGSAPCANGNSGLEKAAIP